MCLWVAGPLARPSQWWSTWNKVTTPPTLTNKTLVSLVPSDPSVSLSCSAGHRAAGCLPGSGVPAPPEDHHPPGEGLWAAALCGQVSHHSKSCLSLIGLKINAYIGVGLTIFGCPVPGTETASWAPTSKLLTRSSESKRQVYLNVFSHVKAENSSSCCVSGWFSGVENSSAVHGHAQEARGH